MAIQIRRGNEADLDIFLLKPGEAAVCLDSGKMIVKLSGGNYLTLTDTDAIQEIVDGKAEASHTHSQLDVTGLADALAATQTALNAKQDALTAGENITIEIVNGELTISSTDTTYSAGSGISISNGEISNDAPNVQADWNAASGSAAEILNKPTIPNYSAATTSAAGLMSATDKGKLDGQGVVLWESSGETTYSTAAGSNTIQLSESLSGYRFVEVDVSNGTVHTCARAEVTNGETPRFSFLLPTGTGASLIIRMQNIGISTSNNVSTLTVYSSVSYTFSYSSSSVNMATNANWGANYHKIVGYK